MKFDDTKPIFQQVKEHIEDIIMNDTITIGERIPSTNEFAQHYKINPATAAKGINQLVEEGIIYKKRGVGMFVAEQAKEIVYQKRKTLFFDHYIVPLKQEANKLNITEKELIEMIARERDNDEN